MEKKGYTEQLRDKDILITGGLGFIGSNLAIRLVELGARVTLLDAMVEDHGGNLFNIKPIRKRVCINFSDVRDETSVKYLVRNRDYIFHLAGQNDHVLSLSNPFPDIDINIKGTAILLEACRRYNPEVRLIFSGTRGEYGPSTKLPVSEEAPINPKGIYELSSLTAQKLFKIYHDNHSLRSVTLRLTNIYGERAQMRHSRFGVANWFIRLAIDNETIKVFGDGSLKRDFLYIDDAIEAMIMCAETEEAYGEVFNVGNDTPSSFLELAKMIIRIARSGRWEFAPFTPERAAQEPGDFYSDISKIRRIVGWEPRYTLKEGLRKTIDYYRKYKSHYWQDGHDNTIF
ncbi:MAG: NAD-dependent epimerase/dehydratase family protein [bacterium]